MNCHSEGVRRGALKSSYWEGVFYSIVIATAENFALVFAVGEGLSEPQIGLLTTAPLLVGALGNLVIPGLTSQRNLKATLAFVIGIQILGIALLVKLSLHPPERLFESLFLALSIYWLGGLVAAPLWVDWMSGWLPQNRLGRFFSRRSSILSLASLFFSLLAALAAALFSSHHFFFAGIFGIALLGRLVALSLLIRRPNPAARKLRVPTTSPAWRGLRSFLEPENLYRPLCIVLGISIVLRFVAHLSAPYLLPYMIHDLGFSTATITWLQAVTHLGTFLFMAAFAENIRRFSLSIATQVAVLGIFLASLAWMTFTHPAAIAIVQAFNGIFWAGLDLCLILWMQAAFPNKARWIMGIHLALAQFAAVVGSYCGGLLMTEGGMSAMNLIEISTVLRGCVGLLLSVILGLYTLEKVSWIESYRFLITLILPAQLLHGIKIRLNF